MNKIALATLIAASVFVTGPVLGQQKTDNMKGMDMQTCMDMKGMKDTDMKGMDMKSMDMQKCKDMMSDKDKTSHAKDAKAMTHKALAVVKAVDIDNGKVTLAHEPIKSLQWPAMTMGFAVKDKMLFDKLAVGKKVNVEIIKQDADYVVTAVK